MSFTVIIPARYASTRLPGKPLQDIGGKPMIQHVWERARASDAARVVIATDHAGVADACASFGGEVCMTREDHESGTDRLQEVVSKLGLDDSEIVVNVQGDEPLIPPALINQVAANLAAHPGAGIATLGEPIDDEATIFNPNAVKVVVSQAGYALYFSRAPIPWCRDEWAGGEHSLPAGVPFLRHIGIYGYRVGFLHQFVRWPMGQLEQAEKLEQLRAMENGVSIHIEPAAMAMPAGVDTPADLERVRGLLAGAGQ
ncbi:3-deoxy-manno-octulosonate cytidylyltransferase [Spongiibacter taiwanensis]|uniref:3-deoxy-manno-octulosonate cytidylyltransferase n=1 Tax=Spongiibacter taiwanensis TaxID=1748242 RepID=UPI0020357DEB|nr:3-deoxy-manno-octulosonate cytidylyltransferase [Spongiibacter taiwanensis]USA43511.1 3-deoxy-manno-octulosonate cytidylyltransferase [Spongiibacter taiwanensis]